MVSVLDSGARARVQIAAATLSGNSFRQTAYTHCASVHQAAKLVAALLRVGGGVTAGLAESNGSRVYDSRHLQAGCQEPGSAPEQGNPIRSVIEYGLPLSFYRMDLRKEIRMGT